jgi:two-component system, sensor histidine kinase and response regulator
MISPEPKPRILIVDDDEGSRLVTQSILTGEPYLLEAVADGPSALESIRSLPPDVVILDIMMPGMDGYQVTRQIKLNPATRHIPVILLSALGCKEDIVQGLDIGADEFISKPVHGMELRARVRSMLRIKKQHDSLQGVLKLRDEMAHTIAHDLRNPLSVILGYAELARVKPARPNIAADALKIICEQSRKLDGMITEILMTTKIEHDRLVVQRRMEPMVALLRESVGQFELEASACGQSIEVNVAPDVPELFSIDPNLIRRVFDNLVSNALKYGPSKSVVRVEVSATLDAVTISVSDSGPGIAARSLKSSRRFPTVITRTASKSAWGCIFANWWWKLTEARLIIRQTSRRAARLRSSFRKC